MKIIQTMREMQEREKMRILLIMHKENEKYDIQKMKTRSIKILHVEGEIGREQISIVLVYFKTGNDCKKRTTIRK